jgi:hypothetical protein
MSNIVYLIFGFALVVIAFMNIFGRSSYAIKATLPKLILGVITVPFTWFFVSFILSIVNVLTLSVSQSPMTLLPESSKSSTFEMCDEYNISFKDISI